MLVDSLLNEPVLERVGDMYVLHLPVRMAEVLYDSLPGFSPFERSAYKTDLVKWVDSSAAEHEQSVRESGQAALSVVVGDFNGDSRRDVAMRGASRDSSATVFLLAPNNGRPASLIFIGRPQQLFPSEPEWVYLKPVHPGTQKGFEEAEGPVPLNLRTDAVEVVAFEKASTIVFLENGTLQRFSTSD